MSIGDLDVSERRLLEIIRAVGWGKIVRVDVVDGQPVRVVAQIEFDLRKPLGSKLIALGLDKKN